MKNFYSRINQILKSGYLDYQKQKWGRENILSVEFQQLYQNILSVYIKGD